MIIEAGVDLPVKVVEETSHTVDFLVLAKLERIGSHRRFDCQHVTDEIFVFDEFADYFERIFACHIFLKWVGDVDELDFEFGFEMFLDFFPEFLDTKNFSGIVTGGKVVETAVFGDGWATLGDLARDM